MASGGSSDEMAKYVLIGGGLASATAAKTIREKDPAGRILLIAGEPELPYNRPPLSKEYLRGESEWKDALVAPEEEYIKQKIEVRRGVRATKIDTTAKCVTLADGTTVQYERLLLATGSSARTLSSADVPGADASNLYTLRTRADAEAIRPLLKTGASAVLLGAGYIGMEVAADACQKGAAVTIVDTGEQPWGRFASPAFGGFLRRYYEAKGVRFVFKDSAAAIETDTEGRAIAVKTKSGLTLPCDFVLAGIGAQLNLELAQTAAGLTVDAREGVSVNEFLETDTPMVWAAGDIACFDDPVLGKKWHVEHWQNAEWHGQIAGANMAGGRVAYDHIPYFFSDEFDLHLLLRGDPQGGKTSFIIGSTELNAERFLELYLREDGTLAMGLVLSKRENEDATSDVLEKLIRAKTAIAPHRENLLSGAMRLEDLSPPG